TAGSYGKEYADEKGFNVVFYDSYGTGTTDLTPILTKAKAAEPAIFLNPGSFLDAMLLMKQMRELDFNIKLIWPGTGAVLEEFYDSNGKYAEGCVTCTQWEEGFLYRQDFGPSHDEFIDAYQKEYDEMTNYTAATGYQQGLVVQKAMEHSSDPLDSDSVRKTAGEIEMTTFYGKYKVDSETGWQIGHQMGVVQWQNGKKAVVWPLEAGAKEVWYPLKKWSDM
ncbi:MAG: ABC transporter substrate-binding protein, partial [Candidatus Bathyarchaeia archaeon]